MQQIWRLQDQYTKNNCTSTHKNEQCVIKLIKSPFAIALKRIQVVEIFLIKSVKH